MGLVLVAVAEVVAVIVVVVTNYNSRYQLNNLPTPSVSAAAAVFGKLRKATVNFVIFLCSCETTRLALGVFL